MPRIVSIDSHIGARLRRRRAQRGLSQAALAERAGLTFEQVQKYEKGEGRIGAGLLHRFGEALGTDASYFYERLPPQGVPKTRSQRRGSNGSTAFLASDGDPLAQRDTALLVNAYYKIKPEALRRQILRMVETLGGKKRATGNAKAGRRRKKASKPD